MNGYKMSAGRTAGATYLPPSNVQVLADEVDWRTKGYVTPVKNQVSGTTRLCAWRRQAVRLEETSRKIGGDKP